MDLCEVVILCLVLACSVTGTMSHDHSDELGLDSKFLENLDLNDDVREKVENLLKRRSFVRNREHLQEHVNDFARVDLDKATDSELDFQFFNLHDTNNDHRLDGLELLASMMHSLQHQFTQLLHQGSGQPYLQRRVAKATKYISRQVDKILEEEDLDDDGYLTYTEFASARKTALILQNLDTMV